MKTEQIERYLTRQMTDEERAAFEQEMKEQPQLAEDVKIVAWTIEAIRERGRQKDAETIRRMREGMGSDSKRYATTVAAVIGGVLVVAAMTVVSLPPLYQNVIKPIIENVFTSQEKKTPSAPQQPSSSKQSNDSLAANTTTDSVEVADESEEEQTVSEESQKQEQEPAKEEKVKEEPKKEEAAVEKVKPKEETKEEAKEDKPLPTPAAKFTPVTKSIGSTKYTLTDLTGNSAGVVTAYVTMTDEENDVTVDIGDFDMVAESRTAKFKSAVFSNGKNKFRLRKKEMVNIQIQFVIDERPLNISTLYINDRNSIHDVRFKNLPIQWK